MNRRICCLSVLAACGIIVLVAGIVLIPEQKTIIHDEISKQLNLNQSETYDNWVKNPTPIYFQVWVWHINNTEEVKNGGKPHIMDKGPYTYRESRQKVGVKFNDNNKTVTYRENRYFHFERSMSVGPESDTFTTINIPMMVIANIVKKEFSLVQEAAEALLLWSNETLFVTLSVEDIIWGYTDPLLAKAAQILKDLHLKFDIPDKFGLFYNANGTDDGVYNIKTGLGDVSLFGKIKNWNYEANLTYWTTNSSNMINGTDGTIYHPFVEKSDRLFLFSSDLCRSIYLTYTEDASQKGISVYRFVAPPEVFLNETANPANEGFCYPAQTGCLPSGLLNVENCRTGAPVVFSQPHFLAADPSVINAVDGVHPDARVHQTVLDIEPNTGAAFAAAKKLQINIQMEEVPHITETSKLRHIVLPVMWLNESSQITDDLADKFKSAVQTPMKALKYGSFVAVGVGIAIVCGLSLYLILKKIFAKRARELQPVTETVSDTANLVPGEPQTTDNA